MTPIVTVFLASTWHFIVTRRLRVGLTNIAILQRAIIEVVSLTRFTPSIKIGIRTVIIEWFSIFYLTLALFSIAELKFDIIPSLNKDEFLYLLGLNENLYKYLLIAVLCVNIIVMIFYVKIRSDRYSGLELLSYEADGAPAARRHSTGRQVRSKERTPDMPARDEDMFASVLQNEQLLDRIRSNPNYRKLVAHDYSVLTRDTVHVDPHDGGPTDEEYLAMFLEQKRRKTRSG